MLVVEQGSQSISPREKEREGQVEKENFDKLLLKYYHRGLLEKEELDGVKLGRSVCVKACVSAQSVSLCVCS